VDLLRQYSADADKKIFIRGAGNNARRVLSHLIGCGIRVEAFVDANCKNLQSRVAGLPVISAESMYALPNKSYFIVNSVQSDKAYLEIRDEFQRHGLTEREDYFDFANISARYDLRGVEFMGLVPAYDSVEEKMAAYVKTVIADYTSLVNANTDYRKNADIVLNTVNLVCTEICTLRCSNCCTKNNQILRDAKSYDADKIVYDLDKLLSVAAVTKLVIMGGEIFCHPNYISIIKALAKMKSINRICCCSIYSNGTLLPSEEFYHELKKLSIPFYVQLSTYAKSAKTQEIAMQCKHYGIPCLVMPEDVLWFARGNPGNAVYDYTGEQREGLYQRCFSPHFCYGLQDGKFYICNVFSSLQQHNVIADNEADYVDLRSVNDSGLKERLTDYLYNTKSLTSCNYCTGTFPNYGKYNICKPAE
jgi:hypothetical protein